VPQGKNHQKTMTEQEINIAIHDEIDGVSSVIRDYCHDLNAMKEARKSLPPEQRVAYQHELGLLTPKDPGCSCWDLIDADALAHATAFLRVKGLWRDKS
jgi:hypothetical protein